MKDRMTFDEAMEIAKVLETQPADALMAIYEDRMLDLLNMVLLELQFRNGKGIAFNRALDEVERLKARKAERDDARKKIIDQYRAQKGAS